MSIPAHFLMQAAFGASRLIEISHDRMVIGRSPQADIVIDEPGLPAIMGLVVRSGGSHHLVADSDRRPFSVNGAQTARALLGLGDRISFDECELIFEPGEPEPVKDPAPASEPSTPSAPNSNPWSLFRPASAGPASDSADSNPVSQPAKTQERNFPGESAQAPIDSWDAPAPHRHSLSPSVFFHGPSLAPSSAPPSLLGEASPWHEKTWGKLIAMHGSSIPDIELSASLCLLDLGLGKATLSRRHGQCYATLVSGVVFCSKDRLGAKPRELVDNDLIASGARVYLLRLAKISS